MLSGPGQWGTTATSGEAVGVAFFFAGPLDPAYPVVCQGSGRRGGAMDPIGAGMSAVQGAVDWLHSLGGGFGLLVLPLGALALISLWFGLRR